MVAQAATSHRADSSRLSPAVVQLLYALTISMTVALLLITFWLLIRRIGGQLQHPLSTATLVAVAVIVASLAASLRVVWYRTGLRLSSRRLPVLLVWMFPSLIVLMLGIALSITGTGIFRLLCFWSILLISEGAWWWFAWRQPSGTAWRPGLRRSGPSSNSSDPNQQARTAEMQPARDEVALPESVSQQITRASVESDKDTVSGLLRAHFAPRERSQSLHVAFCPPMLRPPKVTVVQLSGPRVRIKAADVQNFGVRFDLRLATAAHEEQNILIHFEARCVKPEPVGLGGLQH